jgi:hypothetical protein
MLDLLRAAPATLAVAPATAEDWYLNLLWIDRRKCVLLTHAGTLFSVFRAGVSVSDLRKTGGYVTDVIDEELRAEGLPPGLFGQLDPEALRIATTASRSTLGFMNDMAVHLRYQAVRAGGLDRCDTEALNRQLRRTLHNHGGYVTSLDLVAQRRGASTA